MEVYRLRRRLILEAPLERDGRDQEQSTRPEHRVIAQFITRTSSHDSGHTSAAGDDISDKIKRFEPSHIYKNGDHGAASRRADRC